MGLLVQDGRISQPRSSSSDPSRTSAQPPGSGSDEPTTVKAAINDAAQIAVAKQPPREIHVIQAWSDGSTAEVGATLPCPVPHPHH